MEGNNGRWLRIVEVMSEKRVELQALQTDIASRTASGDVDRAVHRALKDRERQLMNELLLLSDAFRDEPKPKAKKRTV